MTASVRSTGRSGHKVLVRLAHRCLNLVASLLNRYRADEVRFRMITFIRNVNGDVLVDKEGEAVSLEIWRERDDDYVMLLRSSISVRLGIDMRAATMHWIGGFNSAGDDKVSARTDVFYARLSFIDFAFSVPPIWSWSEAPEFNHYYAGMLEKAARSR